MGLISHWARIHVPCVIELTALSIGDYYEDVSRTGFYQSRCECSATIAMLAIQTSKYRVL